MVSIELAFEFEAKVPEVPKFSSRTLRAEFLPHVLTGKDKNIEHGIWLQS